MEKGKPFNNIWTGKNRRCSSDRRILEDSLTRGQHRLYQHAAILSILQELSLPLAPSYWLIQSWRGILSIIQERNKKIIILKSYLKYTYMYMMPRKRANIGSRVILILSFSYFVNFVFI